MRTQTGFVFDDPDSRTRSKGLDVVHARVEKSERFDRDALFGGFDSMRALTYTPSIPMILSLLRDYDYSDFECIFGHSGILSRDAADLMAFQTVVDEKLNKGFVGIAGISDERRKIVFERALDGKARFFVVKDAIAHAKIYILEREGLRRVVVGSANLSETAFSGRQAETLIAFDNDDAAWEHYCHQYDAVHDVASNRVPLREKPIPAELIPIEETPVLKEADSGSNGISIYVPTEEESETDFSVPQVLNQVERIRPVRRQALADIRTDRRGNITFTSNIVKQMTRIITSRHENEGPKTYLSYSGDVFDLSGSDMDLGADPLQVRSDVKCWLEFFGNYENGFVGDIPRLQRDYFTFMCWFYFSPLMCDLRNAALRQNRFSFDQPMFAVLYGQSNCGKSSLIETLMTSMFSYPRIVETQSFTRSNLRGLQESYKRFPIVFDDVTRERFSRHAPEIIKDEAIHYSEYPCFALSMNAEARSFLPEIVKRCLMIYTRTSLPGDNPTARRRLQRSVASIRDRLTTSLYREYLKLVLEEMASLRGAASPNGDEVDALELSSTILCRIVEENLPQGFSMPDWCSPMTLSEYQGRAFERPRLVLNSLLHPDRFSSERKPAAGSWTVSGDTVMIAVDMMGASRTRSDIPDWILDDTASVSDQIALKRDLLEDFLERRVRPPRRFLFWDF